VGGSAWLTNTILVRHTAGIGITSGGASSLETTLWDTDTWANVLDWNGDDTVPG
jgi:hypothetical protein